ncbi:hypothetical protein B0T26DRAFT_851506 [Lasiosphaeria miniovina]|uniref:Uncharacterized protein n=1 Tax=Lasiosphaeria miniovina TaxID=1954250 RepID=A0AA40E2H7_9PEZI|nr:uncharacterized protein B0T26DRAFT_851506 [Lasiosphaeria miniovina]KAK0722572.1 hypothetical protein B0T26DRAFT_851506 [Lasiosphaeria miniovina]
MASLLDLGSANWSYYSVPAAFVLVMIPHTYANFSAGKNYDLANPRKTEEYCAKDTTMDKVTLRRISRARAAVSNGFETLGLYAAGIVAANASGAVPTATLNALALGYLVSRAIYNYIYVFMQDNARAAPLRSLVWLAGLVVIFSLFLKAGGGVVN